VGRRLSRGAGPARALLVLACALLSALHQARADAAGDALLAQLLAGFAQVQSLKASFQEEKHMALLAVPLRSQGVLHYAKPRLLLRRTESPQRSSLVLNGDRLSFGDASHQESLELSAQPAVRVLVDTFVSVLAGDGSALARLAELAVEALPGGGFRIQVTPKDPGVLKIVRRMSFEGKGARLTRMELLDANGDRTLTTFSELQLGGALSEADKARIFRVGG
jgi:outer membrane lipoprotein-sorting protein